ncbi:MAG: hypothetical protein OXH75_01060 [Acidobacteria bacterium]|nr:hypothetical protein [Acidobacteriota bacterium]
MQDRHLAAGSVGIAVLVLGVSLTGMPAGHGSTAAEAAEAQSGAHEGAMRTPWGDPDLQGVWDFRTITPLERPAELADQEFLTEEEAAGLESAAVDRSERLAQPSEVRTEPLPAGGSVGAYNDFWFDRGFNVVASRRTSLIIDPPDGRIPALTPAGQQRAAMRSAARARPAVTWEDRSLFERCVTRGLPRLPGGYNQNLQILQTPDHVVILYEMMREARVIPLDGRPHLPAAVRLWHGDSRARWEGDTLVVETTNFSPKNDFRGAGAGLRLIERFTRVDADTIEHQVTISDPTTFTRAWTAAIPLRRTDAPMYEYACHEGNYGMEGIMAGARADDRR